MNTSKKYWDTHICPAFQQSNQIKKHFSALAKGYSFMKKKCLICAFIAICLSIVAYGTTAYFSYEDTATNVITAGDIKIDLQEWSISNDNGELIPFKDAIDVQPGMEISKIVQIENIGGQDAWVRILVDKTIALADGVDGDIDLSLISYDLNTEYWTEQNGYYYYNTILKSGETTEPLFTKVKFSSDMSNLYQYSKAVIGVKAQATQVIHNGETVFAAGGWPKSE